MELVVREDPLELEGTHRVSIFVDDSARPQLKEGPVLLRKGSRACGAIASVKKGQPAIALDKYLRIYLRLKTDDVLEAQGGIFPTAQKVEMTVPSEYERKGLARLVRDFLVGKPLVAGQAVPLFIASLTGEQAVGEVSKTEPDGVVAVTEETELSFKSGKVQDHAVTYKGIGGLKREIERLRELVEYPIRHPEIFRKLGIVPPRGILLYGPPGTGKTMMARALAHEAGASVQAIHGPEIMSAWYGGSEENLRRVFEQARSEAPSMILIDEIDSIAPRRDKTRGDVEHRVVATLLTFMDGLCELKDVVVVGTTNSINSIDPALRRPGRFEHEIHIGAPDTAGRKEILEIHTQRMPLGRDVDLEALAKRAHGFVGADLASLCREAAYCALRESSGGKLREDPEVPSLSQRDFERAFVNIKPSAIREVRVEIPQDISWASIGGLTEVKRIIVENIVYGISKREAFAAVGIKPARGILLYGPPGTGKTLIAKVVARESGANFIAVRGPELRSKWFGETEEKIRFIFSRARETAPCVIFFDELDAIAPTRGSDLGSLTDPIVNQLLAEMDGIDNNDNLCIIGATNKSELVDQALLRPGRFEYQVYVPLPDKKDRESIFAVHLKGKPVGEFDIDKLTDLTDGFSGADIAEVCRLAALAALRENDFRPDLVQITDFYLKKAIDELEETKTRLNRPVIGFRQT